MTSCILGATGNIGYRTATNLLTSGHTVRVVSRSLDSPKMKHLIELGGLPFQSALHDSEALEQAFRGVDLALVMTPAEYTAADFRKVQVDSGKAIASALKKSGVKKIISVSGVGANVNDETGVVKGLYFFEKELNQLSPPADIFHLRPTYFMENFYHLIHPIKTFGIACSPMKPNIKVAMVATQDVADAAVELIKDPSFTGIQSRELLGPSDLDIEEAIRVLGKAVGQPKLRHVRLPDFLLSKGMQQAGNSADLARLSIEMHKAFYERKIEGSRNSNTTTATSIHEFAKQFKERFESAPLKQTALSRWVYGVTSAMAAPV